MDKIIEFTYTSNREDIKDYFPKAEFDETFMLGQIGRSSYITIEVAIQFAVLTKKGRESPITIVKGVRLKDNFPEIKKYLELEVMIAERKIKDRLFEMLQERFPFEELGSTGDKLKGECIIAIASIDSLMPGDIRDNLTRIILEE